MSCSSTQDSGVLRRRVVAGDKEALAELFGRNKERLRQMLVALLDKRLYGRVDPEDVLQEAFLDAADRIDQYSENHSGSFFVWLRMNVKQTLINVHRRHLGVEMRSAHREVSLHARSAAHASSTSFAMQLLGQLTSPSQLAIRYELLAKVDDALEAMNPIDREVLILRHFEQLTNSEVAEELGIQKKAASIRYTRALRRLKVVFSRIANLSED